MTEFLAEAKRRFHQICLHETFFLFPKRKYILQKSTADPTEACALVQDIGFIDALDILPCQRVYCEGDKLDELGVLDE